MSSFYLRMIVSIVERNSFLKKERKLAGAKRRILASSLSRANARLDMKARMAATSRS